MGYSGQSGGLQGILFDGDTWATLQHPDIIEGLGATQAFKIDGDVDGHDFLMWQRGGSPAPLIAGELAIWQTSYGAVSLAANSVTVPEPATLTLLILAYAGGCAICRSARQVS